MKFNTELSLIVSVLLHGGVLILAAISLPQQKPLPLGAELAYFELTETTRSAGTGIKKLVSAADAVLEAPQQHLKEEASGTSSEVASVGASQGREGVAEGVEVAPEVRYLFELKKLLERKKVYPQIAKAMGYSGTVRVEFTMGRDGEIRALKVAQSAHPVLDEAAQKLIRSIEKQKPFPMEIARSQWTIEVPIEYSLR